MPANETPQTTERFPIVEDAALYREAHDKRVKQLYRMTAPSLRALRPGAPAWFGDLSKDDLVSTIVRGEYPVDLLNEASHVMYHLPGSAWSACNWCHPQHGGVGCDCDHRGKDAR